MKAVASHSFRHYETTLTHALLNYNIVKANREEGNVFEKEYLLSPTPVQMPGGIVLPMPGIERAAQAMLGCGLVSRGDVAMTTTGAMGKVKHFMGSVLNDGCYHIVCVMQRMDDRGDGTYSKPGVSFVTTSDDIAGTTIWTEDGDRVRVILPPVAVTWNLPR